MDSLGEELEDLNKTAPGADQPPPVLVKRRRLWFWPALVLVLITALIAALFIGSYRLYNQKEYFYRFDRSVKGWSAIGTPEGIIALAPDEPVPDRGKGCLKYAYVAMKEQFTGVAMWVPNLKYLSTIEMWVASDETRDLVIGVEQDDGASFLYYVPVQKGVWKYARAAPRMFMLNQATPSRSLEMDVAKLMNKILLADVSGLRDTTGPNRISIAALKVTRALP